MATSNQGFAAIVASVERLRDTTGAIGARQLGVGRRRYHSQVDQNTTLKQILGELKKLNTQKTPRGNDGRFISRQTLRRQQQADAQPRDKGGRFTKEKERQATGTSSSFLAEVVETRRALQGIDSTLRSVAVFQRSATKAIADFTRKAGRQLDLEDKGRKVKGVNPNQTIKIDFKELINKLPKAIATEIHRKPLKVQTGILEKVGQGLVQGVSNRLVKGFDRGAKKNTGVNIETVGYAAGNFATNPKGAVKEGVQFRRKSRLDDSVAKARAQAETEDVKVASDKPNFFVVGGSGGTGGRAGVEVKRQISKLFGKKGANVQDVKNPATDPSVSGKDDEVGFLVQQIQKTLNNLVFQGQNQDAIDLAAKVMAARKKDPKADVRLVGHSSGGQVVEEAIAILERAGITNVRGAGLGTPDIGVGYGSKNYRNITGADDRINEATVVSVAGRENRSNDVASVPNIAQLEQHKLADYLTHPEVLQEIAPEKKVEKLTKAIADQIDQLATLTNALADMPSLEALEVTQPERYDAKIKGLAELAKQIKQGKEFTRSQEGLEQFEQYYATLAEYIASAIPEVKTEFESLAKVSATKTAAVQEQIDAVEESLDLSPIEAAIATLQDAFDGLAVSVDKLREVIDKIQAPIDQMRGGANKGTALSRQYADRLSGIVDTSRRSAEESVRTLIPNFKEMGLGQKRNTAAQYNKALQSQVKAYRKAVADGDKQLAVELGEKLLADAQTVDKVYGDLLSALPTDYVGTRSLQAQRNQVKRVQNEVLKGDKGKGRVSVGLPDMIAEAEGMADSGDNAAQSFIGAIWSRIGDVSEAGAAIGEEAIAGAKDSLGIKSPSREFFEIAMQVVQGWNDGLEGMEGEAGNNVREFVRRVDEGVAGGLGRLRQGFGQLFNKIGEAFPLFGQLKNIILGFGAAMILDNVLEMAVSGFAAMASGAFDSVVAFESLNRAFLSIAGSSSKAQSELKFVADTAKRLGIDLKTAEDSYLGMMSTTRGTALEGTQTQQMFDAFAQTASVRGLSNEEQGRMFAALQQSLSKQKLSAEEVRGQLGEIGALDFQGTLARSMGVSVAQLDELMSSGELLAADVLPKVAAQYAAENAVVANSSETTAQAIARYQNSLEEFRRSFKTWFVGVKEFFNGLAVAIEWFTKAMPGIIQAVSALGLVLAWNSASLLFGLAKTAIAGQAFKAAISAMLQALKAALPVIATYLGQIILLQLAIDAVGAAFNTTQNRFKEFSKALDTAKASTVALENALAKLNETSAQTKPTLPTSGKDVVTDQTWKPFGFDTGMNLEPVRQVLGLRTLGEKQANDFVVTSGDAVGNAYRTLGKQFDSEKIVGDIREVDKELNKVRADRMNLVRGDRQGFESSVAAEKELLKQREDLLKGTSAYATALKNDITALQQGLSDLDALEARGGITADAAKSTRASMETALADLEKTQQKYDDLTNYLQQSLSALERAMRDLNEQYTAFNENLDRQTRNSRVEFLRQATRTGMGSMAQGMGLQALDSQATQRRIAFLRDQVADIDRYLSDPEYAAILEELREQAAEMGTDLNNSATLERLIGQGGDSGERGKVAETLKRMLELQDELGQAEEQLAQDLLDQKNGLFDLNRTIQDYFQQLNQQIEETKLQVEQLTNQLKYGAIRQRLQRTLLPGADQFMTGLVGTIQGIFDSAGQIIEKVLGRKGARLGFESEKYTLETQMEDFIRSINGATDAVEAFKNSLNGGNAVLDGSGGGQTGFSSRGGAFFPVAKGKIGTSSGQLYGASRDNGARRHQGIDIEAKVGEAVHAVVGGTIKDIKLWDSQVNSHKIVVVGTDGVTYVYGHVVPKAGLKIGGTIGSGDNIAAISAKDRLSSGPHLHFEAWRDGKSYNPTAQISGLPRPTSANLATTSATASRSASSISQSERQAIANLLKRFNSPMTPDDFYAVSKETGVQLDALLTQSMIESGFGTTGRGARFKNPLNWGNDDAGNNRGFASFREGLMAGAKGLKENFNFTSPEQFMNNNFMGKYGIYATDPQYRQKYQAALNQVRAMGITGQAQVATAATQTAIAGNRPDPVVEQVKQQNAEYLKAKETLLNAEDALAAQEVATLRTQIGQTIDQAKLDFNQQVRLTSNTVADLSDQMADLEDQFSPDTIGRQNAAELRQVEATFRNQETQVTERIIELERAAISAQNLANELKESAGKLPPELKAEADGLLELASRLEVQIIPGYEIALAQSKEQQSQLKNLRARAQEFNAVKREERQIAQDLETAQIRQQAAADLFLENQKKQSAIELANLEYRQKALLIEQKLRDTSLGDAERTNLQDQLHDLELIRDAAIATAEYDYNALLNQRELEIIAKRLLTAEHDGNLAKKLKLELQQIDLETTAEIARLNREITDEKTRQAMLEETLADAANRRQKAEFEFINAQIQRASIDRDLTARDAENRANLTSNPFEASAIREQAAIDARRIEFQNRVEELRQQFPGAQNAAYVDGLISREAEILAQDLELIDRQFRDVGETVGDMLSGSFQSFIDALLNGEDALKAFGNTILKSISDLGSQLVQQGLSGLVDGLLGRNPSGGGGGNLISNILGIGTSAITSAATSALTPMPIPFVGKKFAEGGFTGKGGKWQPMGIVHGGEYVLNKKATAAIGLPNLNFMNRFGELPEFALGGYVGNMENRLLSGLNAIQSPQISLPPNSNTPERRSAATTTNTVTVNINDKESRFYRQSRTLAREMASELRNV